MSQAVSKGVSKRYIKSLPALLFFSTFFGLFLYFIIPKYTIVTEGFPPYLTFKNSLQKVGFVIHILAGIVVYTAGVLQFIPMIRTGFPKFHRTVGKIYITASFFCVAGLYGIATIIPVIGMSISEFINGGLWISFVVLAYRSILQRNVVAHQRFMISSFICASYFVTIRLVDRFCMPFFMALSNNNEELALTISDFSVFVVPLFAVWVYWGSRHYLITNAVSN